ncbi:hypothetical protein Tco_0409196 [Tanacetum coccineum]
MPLNLRTLAIGLISLVRLKVNSNPRTFFEKEKLTGANFIDWYRNIRIVLTAEDKLTFLEHPIPAMHVPAEGQVLPLDVLIAHQTWVKA